MHSVCLSVCARFNSGKYSSNVLKFKYVTHIRYSLDRIENDVYGTHRSSTETHKSFLIHYGLCGGKDFKRILICLYCNKWNKINI